MGRVMDCELHLLTQIAQHLSMRSPRRLECRVSYLRLVADAIRKTNEQEKKRIMSNQEKMSSPPDSELSEILTIDEKFEKRLKGTGVRMWRPQIEKPILKRALSWPERMMRISIESLPGEIWLVIEAEWEKDHRDGSGEVWPGGYRLRCINANGERIEFYRRGTCSMNNSVTVDPKTIREVERL